MKTKIFNDKIVQYTKTWITIQLEGQSFVSFYGLGYPATYDYWNELRGKIVKITDKYVTIASSDGKNHRMSLDMFSWRHFA